MKIVLDKEDVISAVRERISSLLSYANYDVEDIEITSSYGTLAGVTVELKVREPAPSEPYPALNETPAAVPADTADDIPF